VTRLAIAAGYTRTKMRAAAAGRQRGIWNRDRRRSLALALRIAFGVLCLTLVLYCNRQDLPGVSKVLGRAPVCLAVSFSFHLPQLVLTALAWRALLQRSMRPPLTTMIGLRWIRESLNALVPAGAIIGQALAAQRLTLRGMAAELAGATATVDLTIEAATQAFVTLVGVSLLLGGHLGQHLRWIALTGILLSAAATAAMVVAQRNLPVRIVEAAFARLDGRWTALKVGWFVELQRSVLRLHANRRALAQASIYHLSAWTIGAVEITGVLLLLGHPLSLSDGLIVESVAQALRSAAFVIPGGVGLQEGAIIASCALVGVPPDAALMLALLRRAREVLISIPGLEAWRRLRYPTLPFGTAVARFDDRLQSSKR
jgi:putative membrane protein